MTIDSHHHFWRYNPAEYPWIGEEMAALRRDFLPADLGREIAAAGIDGVISVQARQTLEETHALLDMARENEWIRGVVGWVPLISPDVESILEELGDHAKLKAVRHVVQGEADGFLARPDFNAGIAALESFGLIYDVLILERQLEDATALVDRHPDQVFVLDHLGKPRIKDALLEPWKTQIESLAKRENVWCKVSGMVTEADFQNWSPDILKPYFETVLAAFGPSRLMFGSDWPVCLAACSYGRWVQVVREWTAPLSSDERAEFWGGTAARVYGL